MVVLQQAWALAGRASPEAGGLICLSPLPSIVTKTASWHRRPSSLLSMEKTAIAHLYRRSGAASTIARRHHDVQLNVAARPVRGGQMSSARKLHAQKGRRMECGCFCVHNATIIATMESTSYPVGRVHRHSELSV